MAGDLSFLYFNFEISEQYLASSALRFKQYLDIFICTLLKSPEVYKETRPNQTKKTKTKPKTVVVFMVEIPLRFVRIFFGAPV